MKRKEQKKKATITNLHIIAMTNNIMEKDRTTENDGDMNANYMTNNARYATITTDDVDDVNVYTDDVNVGTKDDGITDDDVDDDVDRDDVATKVNGVKVKTTDDVNHNPEIMR
eukprot:9678295-Ditylum_brightwellii.AAC.2